MGLGTFFWKISGPPGLKPTAFGKTAAKKGKSSSLNNNSNSRNGFNIPEEDQIIEEENQDVLNDLLKLMGVGMK